MKTGLVLQFSIAMAAAVFGVVDAGAQSAFERLPYNHRGLVVDLGVGLWAIPLPCDFDGDGDNDLVVSTNDKPYNGVYFFENPDGGKLPVFKPAVRLGDGEGNVTISYLDEGWLVASPGKWYPKFKESAFTEPVAIPFEPDFHRGRTDQWRLTDYDGDGLRDLIVGASDWRDYGWDNAFNGKGQWLRGPLHAYVYCARNTGTNDAPVYERAFQVEAAGAPIDVYGCPSPNFADWDGDGDLDLICGEFLDKFTYFENAGTRTAPQYTYGRRLMHEGAELAMDLEMIRVVSIDWDGDGDEDLVVGQEDGRVALVENTGALEQGMPHFLPPVFFRQEAQDLKVGALCTPAGVDWDGDGDEDLIVGDTAGYLNFVENLDGGDTPKWTPPVYLVAGGTTIRIQAGPNGSIQGPAEAKWGYTVPCVADWNGDGLLDVMINSIWGEVLWYENEGTRTAPKLKAAQNVHVDWPDGTCPPKPAWVWWTPAPGTLVTQWRTSPMVIDWDADGDADLVMLDHEGYLAFFERIEKEGSWVLKPGQRVFADETGAPLRLNEGVAGKSGRRKLVFVDWDMDGRLDLMANSVNVDFWKNIGEQDGRTVFKNMGQVDSRVMAGHSTCPTTVDWDKDGTRDLLVGAEDGFLYYLRNPHSSL